MLEFLDDIMIFCACLSVLMCGCLGDNAVVTKKILFIGPTRVGDTILASSVLNDCYSRWPNARFSVVTSPFSRALYEEFPALEELKVVTKSRESWLRSHWLDIWSWAVATRWDLVIDMRSSLVSALLFSGERKVFRGVNDRHMILQFTEFMGQSDPLIPRIWYSQNDEREACAMLDLSGPYVVVSPFSNWRHKDWPVERYVALLNHAIFEGYTIILTGITKDSPAGALQMLVDGIQRPVVNLFDQGHLRHMIPIFERSALFIGSDSGLMHLSASTKCPTIGLFGPTNALRYGPWRNTTVQCPGAKMNNLTPEVVIPIIQRLFTVREKVVGSVDNT